MELFKGNGDFAISSMLKNNGLVRGKQWVVNFFYIKEKQLFVDSLHSSSSHKQTALDKLILGFENPPSPQKIGGTFFPKVISTSEALFSKR